MTEIDLGYGPAQRFDPVPGAWIYHPLYGMCRIEATYCPAFEVRDRGRGPERILPRQRPSEWVLVDFRTRTGSVHTLMVQADNTWPQGWNQPTALSPRCATHPRWSPSFLTADYVVVSSSGGQHHVTTWHRTRASVDVELSAIARMRRDADVYEVVLEQRRLQLVEVRLG